MVSIKRIAHREGVGDPENSSRKKDGNRGWRERNKSEERRREFMFRMHGNLWAANWRGGIGIEVKRWETEMKRWSARSRGCMPRNF